MADQVKRYDEYACGVYECSDGEFVRWDDYQSLLHQKSTQEMQHVSEHTLVVNATGEEFTVRLYLDAAEIAKELAYKAFRNKSKKATALSKTVLVEVLTK